MSSCPLGRGGYDLVDTSTPTLFVSGFIPGFVSGGSARIADAFRLWADVVAVREVSLPEEVVDASAVTRPAWARPSPSLDEAHHGKGS